MITAATTPMTIPAMAPPDTDELSFLFSAVAAVDAEGVAVADADGDAEAEAEAEADAVFELEGVAVDGPSEEESDWVVF